MALLDDVRALSDVGSDTAADAIVFGDSVIVAWESTNLVGNATSLFPVVGLAFWYRMATFSRSSSGVVTVSNDTGPISVTVSDPLRSCIQSVPAAAPLIYNSLSMNSAFVFNDSASSTISGFDSGAATPCILKTGLIGPGIFPTNAITVAVWLKTSSPSSTVCIIHSFSFFEKFFRELFSLGLREWTRNFRPTAE